MINTADITCQTTGIGRIQRDLVVARPDFFKCYTGDAMLSGFRQQGFLALLFILVFIILAIILVFSLKDRFNSKSPLVSALFPVTGEIVKTPYVSANGTKLYANGELYQFTGVNVFNLGSYTGNAGCGGQVNNLDNFFSKLRPNSAVRMWAFQGSITTNVSTKQTDWSGLDRVVEAAKRNNIKLILTLSDQSGTCDDGHWKDKSWYESGYKKAFNDNGLTPLPYLDYVKKVVSRYKDSTAIAMWEPVNEPESADCTNAKGSNCYNKQTCDEATAREALKGFFDNVGGEIKKIDKNHLVSSGVIGSGQCGAIFEDYKYLHTSPGIDVASYHDYGSDDMPMPGDVWNGLQKRLDQMKQIGKPLIIGESGMLAMDNNPGCISYAARRDKLKAKMDAQFQAGIAGFMPWDLTGGTSPICNFDIVDNDPTIALLKDYPVSMGTIADTQPPTAPANLTASASAQVTLTWEPSTDNVGVVRYDIFRDDTYFNTTTGTSFGYPHETPGATYTFFVKAKDNAGNNSGSSKRVTVTTPIAQP